MEWWHLPIQDGKSPHRTSHRPPTGNAPPLDSTIELPTASRDELVVPVAVKLIGNQRDGVHLRLGHRHAGRVLTAVEFRLYLKPGLSSCVADAVDDGLVGRQRGATPVRRDVAEESVLDLVPLARAGWEVTHLNGKAGLVRQLLKLVLPATQPIPVAPAGVRRPSSWCRPRSPAVRWPETGPPSH